jgi:hypothetical protein
VAGGGRVLVRALLRVLQMLCLRAWPHLMTNTWLSSRVGVPCMLPSVSPG